MAVNKGVQQIDTDIEHYLRRGMKLEDFFTEYDGIYQKVVELDSLVRISEQDIYKKFEYDEKCKTQGIAIDEKYNNLHSKKIKAFDAKKISIANNIKSELSRILDKYFDLTISDNRMVSNVNIPQPTYIGQLRSVFNKKSIEAISKHKISYEILSNKQDIVNILIECYICKLLGINNIFIEKEMNKNKYKLKYFKDSTNQNITTINDIVKDVINFLKNSNITNTESIKRSIDIFIKICKKLAELQKKYNFIHRQLKADAILINTNGDIIFQNLGLAYMRTKVNNKIVKIFIWKLEDIRKLIINKKYLCIYDEYLPFGDLYTLLMGKLYNNVLHNKYNLNESKRLYHNNINKLEANNLKLEDLNPQNMLFKLIAYKLSRLLYINFIIITKFYTFHNLLEYNHGKSLTENLNALLEKIGMIVIETDKIYKILLQKGFTDEEIMNFVNFVNTANNDDIITRNGDKIWWTYRILLNPQVDKDTYINYNLFRNEVNKTGQSTLNKVNKTKRIKTGVFSSVSLANIEKKTRDTFVKYININKDKSYYNNTRKKKITDNKIKYMSTYMLLVLYDEFFYYKKLHNNNITTRNEIYQRPNEHSYINPLLLTNNKDVLFNTSLLLPKNTGLVRKNSILRTEISSL
jgi:hypothetical protein